MSESELSDEVQGQVAPEGDIARPERLHPLIGIADESMRNIFSAIIVGAVLFTIYDLSPLLVNVNWKRVVLLILVLGILAGFASLLTIVLDMELNLIVSSVSLFSLWLLLYGCVAYSVYRFAFEAGRALRKVFPAFQQYMS